jgi:cell division protein FtsL
MAARGSALRHPERSRSGAGASSARPAASPGAGRERPSLGVVDRRQLLERARRRQARVLFFVSGFILAVALAVAAAGHALLASEQVRADSLRAEVASALATEQNAQLERAQLEQPSRVMQIAENRYQMRVPSSITYLQPVNPGPSVETVQAAASAPHDTVAPRPPTARHRTR